MNGTLGWADEVGLFDVADVLPPPPPVLEDLPARAIDPALGEPGWRRHLTFLDWKREHGGFDSIRRCHGWVLAPAAGTIPSDPADWPDHAVRDFTRTLSCRHHWTRYQSPELRPCSCVGNGIHLVMAACSCGWESEPRDGGQSALDGLDHLYPGWRDRGLPSLARSFDSTASRQVQDRWIAEAIAVYPEGWLEAGGPVLTDRSEHATRHVPGRTPWGGMDVGCRGGVPVDN